jgi:glycosyltransferase 2 family protein
LKTAVRVALSLCIAALLLALLMLWSKVDVDLVWKTWRSLSLAAYLETLAIYVGIYVLRTARFRLLLPPEHRAGFAAMFSINAAYQMAALTLPARIGEATFVVYADRVSGVPPSEGLAALVVARVLDLATLTLGLSIACLALAASGAHSDLPWLAPAGAAAGALAAALYLLSARGDWLVRGGDALVRAMRLDRFERGRRLLAMTEKTADALRRAGGRGPLVRSALISVPTWLFVFLFCALLARGLGLPSDTTLAQATLAAALAIFMSLLPLSAFASFGTLEAGWVLGFGLVGIDAKLATSSAIGFHLVQLIDIVILGVIGHVGMGLAAKASSARA